MSSSDLEAFFEERLAEVLEYVDFLASLESAAASGAPRIENSATAVTAAQMKILYSSVYLQVYNLVEATISRCIAEVVSASTLDGTWTAADLNPPLRKEWVRVSARTHAIDMSSSNRLEKALAMVDQLTEQKPLRDWKIDAGGGGSWDDDTIASISERLGCTLNFSPETLTEAKRFVRDELNSLKLVKNRRNGLAHGSLSFVDCADGVYVDELKRLVDAVGQYLREATGCFVAYLNSMGYLTPDRLAGAGT